MSGGYLPSIVGGTLLLSNLSIPGSGTEVILVNSGGNVVSTTALNWDASGFSGNLSATDDTLQEIFDKLDGFPLDGLLQTDINTLAKLNNIVIDATLVDANHNHPATNISITDSGGHFSSNNVEGALQELGAGGGGAVNLGNLLDVTITSPSDGQLLTWDQANSLWINANLPAHEHNAIDVNITDVGAYFVATDVEGALQELAANIGEGVSNINDLLDVSAVGPSDGDYIRWNSIASEWQNDKAKVPRLIRYELLQNLTSGMTSVLAQIKEMSGAEIHSSHAILDPELIYTGLVIGDKGIGIQQDDNYYIYDAVKSGTQY